MMRVASFHQFNLNQLNINLIQEKQGKQQLQVSTGKEFSRASENPIKAKQAEIITQAMDKVDQYQKNVNDAKGILETTATILQNTYHLLENVNTEVLKAQNGTYNQDDLDTIAMVIDKNIEQLVSAGNTQHLNRYIFSGEKMLTKPYDFDGTNLTYNGNDNDVKIGVSPYIDTTVMSSGNKFFTDTIKNLVTMRDQIKAGDRVGLAASFKTHQTNMDAALNSIAEVGVRLDGLNVVNEGFISQKNNLEARRMDVEDVDFTKLMVDISATQRTYQATLKATTMMFDSSILNYM
ncbi:flagellar hook-associated protein 3 [Bacillus cereus]|uniref:Flagellar hook-associated protein 3 n=3 Tax=Bacillus TaxID=1386 RepID=A0A9X6WHK1_BACTU|nr:flagellar hook-associated protein 3 [Bacillus cereus]PFJ31011.1 flagellar hook-associated protein 3 [Bacillus thuringiensis]PGP12815.1 flagellar hook-associated protein 3 [Bacillus cereus]